MSATIGPGTSRRARVLGCGGLAGCIAWAVIGCGPIVKPDDVSRIRVCETGYLEVKEIFGAPKLVGRRGKLVVWTYAGPFREGWLLIAFRNDVVVDYNHNAPETMKLADQCARR